MKLGIIGCGNIASIISGFKLNCEVVALYDRHLEKAKKLEKAFGAKAYESFDDFIKQDFDTVLETASYEAVKTLSNKILEKGKNLIILSSGALMEDDFRNSLIDKAKEKNLFIRVPSGALFGVDNAKVLSFTNPKKVFIKSVKNPKEFGLKNEKKLVFKGKASECIKRFPKQTNVTVTISIVTNYNADVEIWADPEVEHNIHEVELEGVFGKCSIKIDNLPSEKNPKTSYLAALSVVALINEIDNNFIVGT
ncbi:aspartate dehydrogenase [Nitrosophilus kaiyonis]|uniref:aspartate dehydrogenase n=1 Tax=Nitrosophilus kaiyonis TaxID=2930200 RepID=UPI002490325A|nr:aspartate dehydrogenase [Nitrosophilus kaiyonis]